MLCLAYSYRDNADAQIRIGNATKSNSPSVLDPTAFRAIGHDDGRMLFMLVWDILILRADTIFDNVTVWFKIKKKNIKPAIPNFYNPVLP